MRALYLSPRICWPPRSGAHLRDFYLARQVANHATLIYVGLETEWLSSGQNAQREHIAELCNSEVVRLRRHAGYSPLNLLRGFLGPVPVSILNFTTDTAKVALEQLLREQKFDAVQVESVHLIAYAELIRRTAPQVPMLCDWHNIESEIQDRYAEANAGSLRAIYARRTAHLLRQFERRFLRLGDAHTVCSERERELLLALDPSARVQVIENGVDVSYFLETDRLPSGPRRNVLFVGMMEYHANVDAVVYFVREIWPRLRERRPDLEFVIVGARPTSEVKALAMNPGVKVTGTVDDLRPYYRSALAAVVPLRVGGGTRLKILEAMAAGAPVVSTTLGAEGLHVTHGEELLLADASSAMADTIAGLQEDSPEWHYLTRRGRQLVLAHYDWSVIGQRLMRVYANDLGVSLKDGTVTPNPI